MTLDPFLAILIGPVAALAIAAFLLWYNKREARRGRP